MSGARWIANSASISCRFLFVALSDRDRRVKGEVTPREGIMALPHNNRDIRANYLLVICPGIRIIIRLSYF